MIEICLLIWFVSVLLATCVMERKHIDVGFWPVMFVILPIVNTIIVVLYYRVDISGLKEFLKQLNRRIV